MNGTGLNKNEKKTLTLLLDNARVTDSEIAVNVGITPQGVRKIRKKLEGNYIDGYRTIVNYEKIGVTTFAIAEMRITNRNVLKDKHIVGAFEVNEANITHILILGFSSLEDLDDYKVIIKNHAQLQKLYVISKKGMLKNSPVELIKTRITR